MAGWKWLASGSDMLCREMPGSDAAQEPGRTGQGVLCPGPGCTPSDKPVLRMLRGLLPCLLIFLLLAPTLDAQSLWWDEGISLHLASSSWAELIRERAGNIHPPLYFLGLKLWVSLAGRTPFAARYLSLMAGVLLPATAHAFVRRRFGSKAGRTAALLLALAPPFAVYAQEARAYAWLPLLYLALVAQVWPAAAIHRGGCMQGRAHTLVRAIALAATESALLLTHYGSAFGVALANLVLLARCYRQRHSPGGRTLWGTWLLSVGLALVMGLPWLGVLVADRFTGLQGQAGLGNLLATPLPFAYFLRLLGIFHTVGLPSAMSDPGLARPSLLLGSLLAAALVALLLRKPRAGRVWLLVALWLLPLSLASLIWVLTPQAHPRYVLLYVSGGWLLVAVLAVSRSVPRLPRGALLASTLVASVLGLRAYLTEAAYARSDVRGVAEMLAAEASPGDIVLVPFTDWSLPSYDTGAARVMMLPSSADAQELGAALEQALEPKQNIYVMDYDRGALDPSGQVRATLAWAGLLEQRSPFQDVSLERYRMYGEPSAPVSTPVARMCVEDDALCLSGVGIPASAVSGAALPIVLSWEGGATSLRYTASLQLRTAEGVLVGQTDDLLLDSAVSPTNHWSAATGNTYHLIPLPVGLLPLTHTVELRLYSAADSARAVRWTPATDSGSSIAIGVTRPVLVPWRDVSLYDGTFTPELLADPLTAGHLQVEAVHVDREAAAPGESVFVAVLWRAPSSIEEPQQATVALIQDGVELAGASVWSVPVAAPAGRPLLTHSRLRVPAEAVDGRAEVALRIGDTVHSIGSVDLAVGGHTFSVPDVAVPVGVGVGGVAHLVGFGLEPGATLAWGEPLTLTLVWQAGGSITEADVHVFTHLSTESGSIAAQHDGVPAEATRPMGGWVPGEFIVDSHVLAWAEPYSGLATLKVGLYDAVTGKRLLWDSGSDALELPVRIAVVSPQP